MIDIDIHPRSLRNPGDVLDLYQSVGNPLPSISVSYQPFDSHMSLKYGLHVCDYIGIYCCKNEMLIKFVLFVPCATSALKTSY